MFLNVSGKKDANLEGKKDLPSEIDSTPYYILFFFFSPPQGTIFNSKLMDEGVLSIKTTKMCVDYRYLWRFVL